MSLVNWIRLSFLAILRGQGSRFEQAAARTDETPGEALLVSLAGDPPPISNCARKAQASGLTSNYGIWSTFALFRPQQPFLHT